MMRSLATMSQRPLSWLLYLAAGCAWSLAGLQGSIRAIQPMPASAILQDLHSFRELGSVLHIAAHPDDENSRLLSYFARGRGCRTAYLSLTRGDGGQNLLGPHFGAALGVIRTQELLAARRLDGSQQFFSRAKDFGFSKDYRQTLTKWDRNQVLSDIVRVIRSWQPDVIITRFPLEAGNTHGHHTASALLAVEAFSLAGDPKAFPEQLGQLKPWQPKRILYNSLSNGRDKADILRLDVSGEDPVLGKSFGEIAGRSRAMHKSQGLGNFSGSRGTRVEFFQLLRGDAAKKDIFDGVDVTWSRIPGGAEVGRLTNKAIEQFNQKDPAASVPALLAIRRIVASLPTGPLVSEKRHQLDQILQACLGLEVETAIAQAEVVPGETLKLQLGAVQRSSVPLRWVAVRYPSIALEVKENVALHAGQRATLESTQTLPASTPLSQPYWLRKPGTAGMFTVDDPKLIGRPENPPIFPVEYVFEVGGQQLIVADEPVQIATDAKQEKTRRKLEAIAPIALHFLDQVALFAPEATRTVEVEVTAFRSCAGTLRLDVPVDWKVEPATQSFSLAATEKGTRLTFKVTAPPRQTTASITASAQIGSARYHTHRIEIRYAHLPCLLLQPVAQLKAVSLDLVIRGRKVGYIPGAGDSVAECLKQMGYAVVMLAGADLTQQRLRGLDAVVIGVRAFNVRTDLAQGLPALFSFVAEGGNVIVQYNLPRGLQTNKLAPFDLKLSRERVTDENAKVTLLASDHPALNTPNKITRADFDGWVQERGLYFPNQWDERFVPLLACNDPGNPPLKGSLLVAPHGSGYFVYTGLSWFRQLPEGVVGAYRLFANLISLGKK